MDSRLSSLDLSTSWTIRQTNTGGRKVGVTSAGMPSHPGQVLREDLLCWLIKVLMASLLCLFIILGGRKKVYCENSARSTEK